MATTERTCVGCGKLESQEPGGEFGGGSGGPWCSDCTDAEGLRSAREDGNGRQSSFMGQSFEPRTRIPRYVTTPDRATYAQFSYPQPHCANCGVELEEYPFRRGRWTDVTGQDVCSVHPNFPTLDHHIPTLARASKEPEEGHMSYTNPTQEEINAEVREEAKLRDQMALETALAEEPTCKGCGRDNRNGTHTALELAGHLKHPFDPGVEEEVESVPSLSRDDLAQLASLLQGQSQQSFEDALASVDPRDSEAALAMLDFLLRTGRLNRVGVLDGGQGYLFVYQEPKGTTKQGYVPGGTQGDRIVDAAVEQARASGQTAAKRGICKNCVSAIFQKEEDACPRLEDEEDFRKSVVCSATGDVHEFA